MKIKGIPVGTNMPRSDWNQEDPTKADYIKNKPSIVLKRGAGQDSVEQVISDKWNGTGNNPYPQATNRGAVAMGKYTQATGKEAMAVNYNTKANGSKSFAANSSNEVNSDYGAAFGHTNVVEATAPGGFAQGIGNKVVKQAQMVTGRFAPIDDSALFVVGDGSSDTQRSLAFAVYPEEYGAGASMKLGDNHLTHDCLAQMIHHIKNPQLERYSMGGTNTYNLVHINDIGNTVSGSRSVVLGANHTVNANYATALNRANTVTGGDAFAANSNNKVTGPTAAAFGNDNEASGNCSFALGGNQNKVSGANSVVTGHMNIASGNEQFVAGCGNQEDPDALFIVGNGTSDNRSNAFTVKRDGTIMIGDAYLNPPMLNGVEYKTAKKHNGKSVYVKRFLLSNLVASGTFNGMSSVDILTGIPADSATVIGVEGTRTMNKDPGSGIGINAVIAQPLPVFKIDNGSVVIEACVVVSNTNSAIWGAEEYPYYELSICGSGVENWDFDIVISYTKG